MRYPAQKAFEGIVNDREQMNKINGDASTGMYHLSASR